jgi:hypothetical protein
VETKKNSICQNIQADDVTVTHPYFDKLVYVKAFVQLCILTVYVF